MPEHQNVENSDLASKNQVHLKFFEREEFGQSQYKINWHEEYLDWICGFANAQGGKRVEYWGAEWTK